jgi:hypothetical protein
MNSDFWKRISELWCKQSSSDDLKLIAKKAQNQAEREKSKTSGYRLNPLDDEDDD